VLAISDGHPEKRKDIGIIRKHLQVWDVPAKQGVRYFDYIAPANGFAQLDVLFERQRDDVRQEAMYSQNL